MANNQFPLYTVVPSPEWSGLKVQPGFSARDIAYLTTIMRESLYEAMGDAVIQTQRTSSLRSRRGSIFGQLMSGRRARGSGHPGTVSVTFMARPWIAIHQTGGEIRPRNSRYLTLPMPAALRADGRLKRRNAAGWKSYGTFVWTSRRTGKKFLVYNDKRTGRLVFLYYLADSVNMRKRMNLRGAIQAQEASVVSIWFNAVMDIFNDIDLYGIAFEGVQVR